MNIRARDPLNPLPPDDQAIETTARTIERLALRDRDPSKQVVDVYPTDDGSVPTFIVPDGMRIERFDDLTGRAAPARHHGVTVVDSLEAFNLLVARFGTDESTVIFRGDTSNPFVHAVFNFSTADEPSFDDFGARFEFKPTEEWAMWRKQDERYMPQVDFAQFVDDYSANLFTVGDVDAMTLVEAARGFRATRKLEFERERSEHTGAVHLVYSETTTAGSRSSDVTVPERFGVEVVPFYGCEPVRLEARFRFDIDRDGALTMGYRFVRRDMTLAPAVADLFATVAEEWSAFPLIQAAPPKWHRLQDRTAPAL